MVSTPENKNHPPTASDATVSLYRARGWVAAIFRTLVPVAFDWVRYHAQSSLGIHIRQGWPTCGSASYYWKSLNISEKSFWRDMFYVQNLNQLIIKEINRDEFGWWTIWIHQMILIHYNFVLRINYNYSFLVELFFSALVGHQGQIL